MQIKDIKLLGDRILIKPSKFYTYKVKEWVKDDELNKGKDPLTDEQAMKEVEREVKSDIQKGVVVSVGNMVNQVSVGDTIMYNIRACAQFELIKGYGILKQYDIVGIINKQIDDKEE